MRLGRLDRFLRCFQQGVGSDDRKPAFAHDPASLVDVRAREANDERHAKLLRGLLQLFVLVAFV